MEGQEGVIEWTGYWRPIRGHRELARISLLECVNCSNSRAQLIHSQTFFPPSSTSPMSWFKTQHIFSHSSPDNNGTNAAFFCYNPAAYTFPVVVFPLSELFSCLHTNPPCKDGRGRKVSVYDLLQVINVSIN